MGDRVSIQFKDKFGNISPYLYSHWGGMDLAKAGRKFAETCLPNEEAGFALVQFIQSPLADCFDDLHLEFDGDGDNDDNGNHVIELR